MNQPSREAMAGKLQIYADGRDETLLVVLPIFVIFCELKPLRGKSNHTLLVLRFKLCAVASLRENFLS
jgi:hypothetical protein